MLQVQSAPQWSTRRNLAANCKNENPRRQLSWSRAADGDWWRLGKVDLARLDEYGVFIVWRNGNLAEVSVVLYVGRGSLRQEIARCRRELFNGSPDLKITWADVDDYHVIDGVAAFLYHRLRPMWGEVGPWTQPLAVNLPAT